MVMAMSTVNPRLNGAKGDNTQDDTLYIQKAIWQAEQTGILHVTIPAGNYKITDTIKIEGSTGLTIDCERGAIFYSSVDNTKTGVLEFKTTSANYWRGRRTTINGLRIISNTTGVGTGVYINGAAQWYLHRCYIENFKSGLKLAETYYGGLAHCCFSANTYGFHTVGSESNTIDVHNCTFTTESAVTDPTQSAVRLEAIANNIKLHGLTIEGYTRGIVCAQTTSGHAGVISCRDNYFELVPTIYDFTEKNEACFLDVDIDDNRLSDTGQAQHIKLGPGNYKLFNTQMNGNKVYVKNDTIYRISLNTDINIDTDIATATSWANGDSQDGFFQVNTGLLKFYDQNPWLYSTRGDTSVYPGKPHLPSIIDKQAVIAISPYDETKMSKAFPIFSINWRDVVFEKGGPVMKSPDGTYYRLVVANNGTLSTVNVTAAKTNFAPNIGSVPILEVGRKEVAGGSDAYAAGKRIYIAEINRTFVKVGSQFEDTTISGKRAIGTGAQAGAITHTGTAYFWNTDAGAEFFYVWASSMWCWCGDSIATASTVRAVGTAAQRPASPGITGMKYYATDTTVYTTWSGSAWV
ncbi:NosD domain-containing protein [Cohnella yongneupensis]|uniref:NosD domain-containing protein n=1 Tax=Cohnella yongneupensis TaxID=425006 RepID=A0ABW0QUG8_9BACL